MIDFVSSVSLSAISLCVNIASQLRRWKLPMRYIGRIQKKTRRCRHDGYFNLVSGPSITTRAVSDDQKLRVNLHHDNRACNHRIHTRDSGLNYEELIIE